MHVVQAAARVIFILSEENVDNIVRFPHDIVSVAKRNDSEILVAFKMGEIWLISVPQDRVATISKENAIEIGVLCGVESIVCNNRFIIASSLIDPTVLFPFTGETSMEIENLTVGPTKILSNPSILGPKQSDSCTILQGDQDGRITYCCIRYPQVEAIPTCLESMEQPILDLFETSNGFVAIGEAGRVLVWTLEDRFMIQLDQCRLETVVLVNSVLYYASDGGLFSIELKNPTMKQTYSVSKRILSLQVTDRLDLLVVLIDGECLINPKGESRVEKQHLSLKTQLSEIQTDSIEYERLSNESKELDSKLSRLNQAMLLTNAAVESEVVILNHQTIRIRLNPLKDLNGWVFCIKVQQSKRVECLSFPFSTSQEKDIIVESNDPISLIGWIAFDNILSIDVFQYHYDLMDLMQVSSCKRFRKNPRITAFETTTSLQDQTYVLPNGSLCFVSQSKVFSTTEHDKSLLRQACIKRRRKEDLNFHLFNIRSRSIAVPLIQLEKQAIQLALKWKHRHLLPQEVDELIQVQIQMENQLVEIVDQIR